MLLLLLLIFIVVPIAELYVIIQVGQAIGALPTIAILIADSLLGAGCCAPGPQRLAALQRRPWPRRPPAREVLDGVLVIFGGALLLTPGLPHRHPRRPAPAAAHPRAGPAGCWCAASRAASSWRVAGGRARRAAASGARQDYDVEGTAIEDDPRLLP